MKKKKAKKNNMNNFFNEMSYELAGDIGAVDNEEMLNNSNLIIGNESHNRKPSQNQVSRKNIEAAKNKFEYMKYRD